ncbi:DUF2197 domain-containing protein [Desulfitibacter alkalitolerans]|uniref:DUF2197 domain-containing protein n=1 Tax=Desulfitibacter alkalitolerans TaxID=264641 RepID=UPI00146FAEF6|nr:DUF2197 domain-containing protein [Desulfitibacter alkalitolerans]
MLVKCSLCGIKEEISKIHKDYQRLASNPQGIYICFKCNNHVKISASTAIKKEIRSL